MPTAKLKSLLGFGFIFGLLGFFGCDANSTEQTPVLTQHCQVAQVFDGDTLACELNGDGHIQHPVEHVRLLGVDAPETRHSRKKRLGRDAKADEPYAIAAGDWLRQHAEGKTVWLERDVRPTDTYGRTLAFVYLVKTPHSVAASLNASLIRKGLAASLFIPPNRHHQALLEELEANAHAAKRGIWQPSESENKRYR